MSRDQGSEGSDTAVYPELARANLLRMRGDYKAAEQQCLTILRRYPNNATANILLGDICAEKGDLDQSMQWYEMALDLAPESQAAQHKLEAVKQRFKEKETAQTVEQLGLPTTKSRAGVYAFALIAAVFVFAVFMYFTGQKVGESKRYDPGHGGTIKPTPDPNPAPAPDSNTSTKSDTKTDADLVKAIQSGGTEGGRVLDAMQDPRTHALIVSYSVLEGEDARPLGAFVAQQAFQQVTNAPVVTIRGLKQGEVVYEADAMRSLYEETLAQSWIADHQSDTNAWIDHILTHEWPAHNPTPTPPPVTGQSNNQDNLPPGDETSTGTTSTASGSDTSAAKADTSKAKEGGTSGSDSSGDSKTGDQGADNNSNATTGGAPGDDSSQPSATTTGE